MGVLSDKIVLSPEEIFEKEFKVDARGYRPQEVDNFLDTIIKDYTEFSKIIRAYEKEIRSLSEENQSLKNEVRQLKVIAEDAKNSDESVSNVDMLRRISQLEKIVYGKDN